MVSSIAFSSSTNPGNDKINFGYTGKIYNDLNDILRRELDYCYTPVLIALGEDNKILDVIFPKSSDSIQDIVKQGFDYILDTGRGTVLTIPKDESLNILSFVKTKLNINKP
jgi:hypothetical protein